MKKIKNCMLLVLLLSIIGNVYADLDKTSAIALSLDSILEESIGKVNIYIYPNQITKNTNVAFTDHIAEAPYNQNWVLFVDDKPTFGWSHPCRYLFIDSISGEYSFINETIFPLNFSDYEKISSLIMPEISEIEMLPSSSTVSRPVNDELYAVLINATPNSGSNYIRYWNNLSAMYCTLTQHYGIPEENIYVHSTDATAINNYSGINRGLDLDKDDDDDILLPSNQEEIENTFSELANIMNSNDKLFVFTTGSGDMYDGVTQEGILNLWYDTESELDDPYLMSSELDDMLDEINCDHITVLMSQNHSGAFIHGDNSIKGDNRTIITSVNPFEYASAELYLTQSDEGDGYGYDEFVYYWTSAIRGCYPVRVNDNNVWKNKPWIDSDYTVGTYPFRNVPGFDTHPYDYTPPALNGEPTLYGAFEYADNWDTLTGYEVENNYHNPYTNEPGISDDTNNNPQFYPKNNFYDRLTLSNMNLTFSDQYRLTEDMVVTNATINVEANFMILGGASLLLENNSTLNINSTSLCISYSELNLNNSDMNFNGSSLELIGRSLMNLENNSNFVTTGNSEIFGSSSNYWIGEFTYVPGDRIVIDNSKIDLGEGTTISSASNGKWDGLFFKNCSDNLGIYGAGSQIRGTITGIHYISLEDYSMVQIVDSDISNITQLKVLDNSRLRMGSTDYYNNSSGIYVEESMFSAVVSSINDNGSNGLTIHNSLYPQSIYQSNIFDNNGSGIEIRNSRYHMTESEIYDNHSYGYLNFSSSPSIICNEAIIRNNGYVEIASFANSFPYFTRNHPSRQYPMVEDVSISGNASDNYLLAVLGTITEDIDCSNLIIDTNDESRFYPSFNSFIFDTPTQIQVETLYNIGVEKIYEEDYITAYDIMKQIINEYPNTNVAKDALSYLPYINKAMNGDMSELLSYIDQIDVEGLNSMKLESKTLIKMSEKDYEEAISLYSTILENPPSDIKELMAELDQAYCYYKLVSSGAKKLPQVSRRKPETANEFNEIQNEIYSKILKNGDNITDDSVPEVSTVSCNNYPNPFNPETNIAFNLPSQSDVKLSIYNLKGQKVKSLISSRFTKGQHSIVWNGRDDSNSAVSSGIYFYKLETDSKSITKKMILIK